MEFWKTMQPKKKVDITALGVIDETKQYFGFYFFLFCFFKVLLTEYYFSVPLRFPKYLVAIYKTQNILKLVSNCTNMTNLFAYTA